MIILISEKKEISTLSFIFLYHIKQKEVLTLFESCSDASTWVMQKELQLTHKNSLKTILQVWLDPLGLNKAVFNYSTPEKLNVSRVWLDLESFLWRQPFHVF